MLRKNLESFLIFYIAISKDELLKVCEVGSKPGILYGNPEVHKPVVDNMPKFRPSFSAINTRGYKLAKFLIPILKHLTHGETETEQNNTFFS